MSKTLFKKNLLRMNINFEGYTKEQVIQALWSNTQYSGLGTLRAKEGTVTEKEIQEALKVYGDKIEFLKGKPLFIELHMFPMIDSLLYDKYNKKFNGQKYFTMLDVKERMKQKMHLLI